MIIFVWLLVRIAGSISENSSMLWPILEKPASLPLPWKKSKKTLGEPGYRSRGFYSLPWPRRGAARSHPPDVAAHCSVTHSAAAVTTS